MVPDDPKSIGTIDIQDNDLDRVRVPVVMASRIFGNKSTESMSLPDPVTDGSLSLERSLQQRRSTRDYLTGPLKLAEISQLVWAAQGITNREGRRTAPSAGALYPLEVYVVAGNVRHLPSGIYRYNPHDHQLIELVRGDRRSALSAAALRQDFVREAAASIVICAVYERTTWKYGSRGKRYVHMEVGNATQNISLQAVSLNLGTVVVGAFHDNSVKKIIGIADEEQPLCIMPVGRIRLMGG